ncbi:hypothetical protein CYMTET_4631 [Cymbomonas tetramitiformis]|uniref:Uncharacterized protein n=1 Tax=Cymbomonas tetramitiformis TaxID=36881 RepID=A0AAE0H0Z2_9CHLO|nr:hypothetical protein CYMTET_4631 [Cymbomonas tetramitiformis]
MSDIFTHPLERTDTDNWDTESCDSWFFYDPGTSYERNRSLRSHEVLATFANAFTSFPYQARLKFYVNQSTTNLCYVGGMVVGAVEALIRSMFFHKRLYICAGCRDMRKESDKHIQRSGVDGKSAIIVSRVLP